MATTEAGGEAPSEYLHTRDTGLDHFVALYVPADMDEERRQWVRRGHCLVKKEYIRENPRRADDVTTTTTTTTTAESANGGGDGTGGDTSTTETAPMDVDATEKREGEDVSGQKRDREEENPDKPRKRRRGRNPDATRTRIPEGATGLCMTWLRTGECRYGETCKWSHDVAAYVASRPADLGDACPLFEERGFCKHGVACRYGSGHLNLETGENTVDEAKHEAWKASLPAGASTEDGELNHIPMALLKRIRKKSSVFERTKAALAAAKAEDDTADTAEREAEQETRRARAHEMFGQGRQFLAPLTTVGNLPFRRVCVDLGVDITVGEMALASALNKGARREWSLVRRHPSESMFGVQLCGAWAEEMGRCCEAVNEMAVDFVDLNCGCPIDMVYKKGMGSGLMPRTGRLRQITKVASSVLDVPFTVKIRTGVKERIAKKLIPRLFEWGASCVTIHGRSRLQRYTKCADWAYIAECAKEVDMPVIGNGDVLSYLDADRYMRLADISGVMVGRGALIKPWIFTELKERRHWDISAQERLEIYRNFANYGLLHWGSDQRGVGTTRRFLLEWLSFTHRYVPVGLLEVLPQHMNLRPPPFVGRTDLETLLSSPDSRDWVKITEMLLGPVPDDFVFVPKHRSNSYQT